MRGFTLIEVLVATMLLAAGLAVAFATVRAASATKQRGEAISEQNERMRAVEGFLRRRIASALVLGFAVDRTTGEQTRFSGAPDRMRFVADLPNYLGRGGPSLHDIRVVDDGGQAKLVISFAPVVGATVAEERPARPPEPMVPDLVAVKMRYRGLNADNQLGEWVEEWETPDRLPVQVSIDIESKAVGRWPRLVVALPQAGNQAPGMFR
ncbi:prepilin-type N-terminal cleavage/methylation domain-containing protein [Luteimonas aquatica]|uniref:prepilin-type N-terminal cleavage/methylation domain-containing protein n=1 Tax=Luteimonas aquatica TaxID=450364 RepID=UPI001F59097B|nr:prepilin-type N-terminal cleavage/methylation domain-containing protein [Luteimonas aquatica]